MRVLFVHPNFPAQFRHMVQALGADARNQVVFVCVHPRPDWTIPGVRKAVFTPEPDPSRHDQMDDAAQDPVQDPALALFQSHHRQGMAAARTLEALKKEGFIPDVTVGHAGWGATLYLRDVFPQSPYLAHCEWYYDPEGADARFGGAVMSTRRRMLVRQRNQTILNDLVASAAASTPTRWQRAQFPDFLQPRIAVRHDGIDAAYFTPDPALANWSGQGAPGPLPDLPGVDWTGCTELLTYVARGFEPYRGFPQCMEAVAALLARRPGLHVALAGDDRTCYGTPPKSGTWKETVCAGLDLDWRRCHFTGSLPYGQYKALLRAGTAHLYLTRPFVLSWSLLEAMSCGCLVVASDTEPVREVMTHGRNGLLAPFHDVAALTAQLETALDLRRDGLAMRAEARRTILERYDLPRLLPGHLGLLRHVAR